LCLCFFSLFTARIHLPLPVACSPLSGSVGGVHTDRDGRARHRRSACSCPGPLPWYCPSSSLRAPLFLSSSRPRIHACLHSCLHACLHSCTPKVSPISRPHFPHPLFVHVGSGIVFAWLVCVCSDCQHPRRMAVCLPFHRAWYMRAKSSVSGSLCLG